MSLGGKLSTWSRVSVVSGLLAIGWGGAALADEGEMSPQNATSPVLDPMAPSSLMAGPSLRETGKVGVMPESSPPAESLTPGEMTWAGQPEKSVQPVAAGFADAPPPRAPVGTIDPMLLNREMTANLAKVENCRIEVARARQVSPAEVSAEPLVLRWTIQPTGQARTRDVLASALTDPDVVTCARAAMSQWRFTPPRGGSMDIERTVSFKNF